jgi:hypothetical protein
MDEGNVKIVSVEDEMRTSVLFTKADIKITYIRNGKLTYKEVFSNPNWMMI